MKILEYKNTQFAGEHDQKIKFTDGINVILGDNESGKSTMIAGMYNTLLKNSKLHKSKDKEFIELYKPSDGREYVDGEITLDIDDKEVKVKKEWDGSGSTKVIIDNMTYTKTQAEAKLNEQLKYGEAIYDKLIFGRQNNANYILDWIFNNKKDEDKIAIKNKFSEALSATNGISIDKLESKLNEKINSFEVNWDFENKRPAKNRGIENEWRSKGSILEAYYDWKEKEKEYDTQVIFEKSSNELKNKLKELEVKISDNKINYKNFMDKKGFIEKKATIKDLMKKLEDEKLTYEEILESWPKFIKNCEKASMLNTASKKNKLLSRIENIEKLDKQLNEIEAKIKGFDDITVDLENAAKLNDENRNSEVLLKSGKLHAKVNLLNGNKAEIRTADGEVKTIECTQEIDADGYINIIVPDVVNITLNLQEINVDELENTIKENSDELNKIYEKYNAQNFENLKRCEVDFKKAIDKISKLEFDRNNLLEAKTLEDLKVEEQSLEISKSIAECEDIDAEIANFINEIDQENLTSYIDVATSKLSEFSKNYESLEKLKTKNSKVLAEFEKNDNIMKKLSDFEDLSPDDIEKKEKELEKEEEDLNVERSNIFEEKISAENNINEQDLGEIKDRENELKGKYEQLYDLHDNYITIKNRLDEISKNKDNPIELFQNDLMNMLSDITKGRIVLSEIDDKMNLNLKSNCNELKSKNIISEGTKETILLAFRIAVLKQYFNEENGFIIFDDVLLDMDPTRRENTIKIIREFAESNQVIFTTCDPEIANMLGGNRIEYINGEWKNK